MHELMENYIHYLEHIRKLSPKSITAYSRDLSLYLKFCIDNSWKVEAVRYEQARRFVAWMDRAGYSKGSINRTLSGIKGFYTYCVKLDICDANPFLRIKSISGGRRLPTVLTHEEVHAIINAPGNDFAGIRDRVIFEMLYSTGCRLAELVGMNIDDLLLEEETIKVLGKGNKERFLFLTGSAAALLSLYLPMRARRQETRIVDTDDKKALLVNNRGKRLTPQGVHYIFRQYLVKLGIHKHVTPHTFRHSFATHILENNAGIRVVQELLGHENISTTQIYSHVSAERLKEVYRESHPHGKKRSQE